jgi:30S ribosomal protein S31
MGRGDKKTRKGKIFAGSFGKARPHKLKKVNTAKKAS